MVLATALVGGLFFALDRTPSPREPLPVAPAPAAPDAAHAQRGPRTVPLVEPLAEPLEPARQAAEESASRTPSPTDAAPSASPAPALADIVVRARRPDGSFATAWTLELDDVALVSRASAAPRARIDVDGTEVRLGRRVGTVHKLAAFARGFASAPRSVTPSAGGPPIEIELALAPAGIVHAAVHDDADRPVADLSVCLRSDLDPARPEALPLDLLATTDAHGAVRFESVPPGSWTLLAGERASPLARRAGIVVSTAELVLDPLRLPPLYPLALRVEDATGRPVANATLTARGTSGGAFDVVTDADGGARVAGLPAGRFRVFAATDGARANLVVHVPNEPRDAVVTIRLRTP